MVGRYRRMAVKRRKMKKRILLMIRKFHNYNKIKIIEEVQKGRRLTRNSKIFEKGNE